MHVLTTLVKSFLRELSDPIMSYDLYENFLNVSGQSHISISREYKTMRFILQEVEDAAERIRCLTVMVDLLPKHNKCVLDRLIYHMARIAHQVRLILKFCRRKLNQNAKTPLLQDSVNRMNAHNLALIFGPCLMRRKESVHAQDQLQDVNRYQNFR